MDIILPFSTLIGGGSLLKHSLFHLQTARWKVTSKEALQRIGEYSEAAITIRGTYFPPGKEPKEGERKIYLAIESMCQGNYFSVLIL